MVHQVLDYSWWLLYLTENLCIALELSITTESYYAIHYYNVITEESMQRIIIAFIVGIVVGYALALFLTKDEMPLFTDPSVMEEARKHLDGSTQAIQEGRKNLLP